MDTRLREDDEKKMDPRIREDDAGKAPVIPAQAGIHPRISSA